MGGTYLTISGQYFYSSSSLPADIQIGGQPCSLLEFNLNDTINTQLICRTPSLASVAVGNQYPGGRGITVLRDNVLTSFNNLVNVSPSASAKASAQYYDSALYKDSMYRDVTVWLIGYLAPETSSNYQFSLNTNGDAVLLLSNDSTSNNKVIN